MGGLNHVGKELATVRYCSKGRSVRVEHQAEILRGESAAECRESDRPD